MFNEAIHHGLTIRISLPPGVVEVAAHLVMLVVHLRETCEKLKPQPEVSNWEHLLAFQWLADG